MTVSTAASDEADGLQRLSARVSQLEDRLQKMLSLPAGVGGPESECENWFMNGPLSSRSTDMAEARWEILQQMLEQEQKARIESIHIVQQTLAELPTLAAQALAVHAECNVKPSAGSGGPSKATYVQQPSETSESATQAFKVLAAGLRSEFQQQLQQSEAELRVWVQSMLEETNQRNLSKAVSEAKLPALPIFSSRQMVRDPTPLASPELRASRSQSAFVLSSPQQSSRLCKNSAEFASPKVQDSCTQGAWTSYSPKRTTIKSPEPQVTRRYSTTPSVPQHGGPLLTGHQSPMVGPRHMSYLLPQSQVSAPWTLGVLVQRRP